MARPPIYQTKEAFDEVVDLYFEGCTQEGIQPTVNGLCLALGMCRDSLWEYAKKEEFSDAVKRARMRLELAWETKLAGNNVAGAIFWLKNQGWTDKTEQTITADVSVSAVERRVVRSAD